MKEIPLTRGAVAIVDDDDYERISKHDWALNPGGSRYALRTFYRDGKKTTIQMHREILHAPDESIIDHINGNGLDNRKSNLRFADTQKNAFNRKKPSGPYTSRFKGVFRRANQLSWTARIKYNNHHVELGTYRDEELAAAVYNYASAIFFGDFRRENSDTCIPLLSEQLKEQVFYRCLRACERRGWYITTDAFLQAYYRFSV